MSLAHSPDGLIPTAKAEEAVVSGPTPGPWECGPDAGHPLNRRVFRRGSKAIAKVYAEAMNVDGGADANARLIAAAPELLEALILLEREMVLSGNAQSRDYGWLPAITKTRAAIAKATAASAVGTDGRAAAGSETQ